MVTTSTLMLSSREDIINAWVPVPHLERVIHAWRWAQMSWVLPYHFVE
jgi:hypothetical protein